MIYYSIYARIHLASFISSSFDFYIGCKLILLMHLA